MDEYRDPAAVGLPETADDDSYADDVHEAGREPDGSAWPLPPDREDGPLALEDFGTTPGELRRGEPLDRRLARERPDRQPPREDPDPALADDLDPDAVGQLVQDTRLLAEAGPVDPRLGSAVSMYDRPITGIPYGSDVGRLVRPGGGYGSAEADEFAYDVGASAGGFGGEELAMHQIPLRQADQEERESTSEPYVERAGRRRVWTGPVRIPLP